MSQISQKLKRKEHSQIHAEGQHYPDTKIKILEEEKLEANIPDEHKGKNPPLNVSKPNSAIHIKVLHTMTK